MAITIIGGDKLKAKLAEMAGKMGPGRTLRVGFLEGATCGKDGASPAPEIAFFNEFGTVERNLDLSNIESMHGPLQKGLRHAASYRHIPARPFFRNMIQKNYKSWGKLLGAILTKQNYSIEAALSLTGEVLRAQLQQSIELFTDPPNALATKKAKGSDKPLEETKNMKNAVAYDVKGLGEGGEKNA